MHECFVGFAAIGCGATFCFVAQRILFVLPCFFAAALIDKLSVRGGCNPGCGILRKTFSGQEARAEAKASCIASSAPSNDPEIRISVAIIRPESCRNTDSATDSASILITKGLSGLHSLR